jgi:NAD-dependent deacetylase
MQKINPEEYNHILFFTGAGMSAESGVPTYRGRGGVWNEYRWEDYACQTAFERDPEKVLKFHELRRQAVLECEPHAGHYVISDVEQRYPNVTVVTQNIDGMHQRAGSKNVEELHGSLWRVRCPWHGVVEDVGKTYRGYTCKECGSWLRPDIVWFGDALDQYVIRDVLTALGNCDLFISIGTSAVVYPAAGFPRIAKEAGAVCIEINPEPTELSPMYDESIQSIAGKALPGLFKGLDE